MGAERPAEESDLDRSEEVPGVFVVPCRDRPELLQPAVEAFDDVASAIDASVERRQAPALRELLATLIRFDRDRRPDPMSSTPQADPLIGEGLVGAEAAGASRRTARTWSRDSYPVHRLLEHQRFVSMSGQGEGGQAEAVGVTDQQEFGRQSASGLPERVVERLVRTPFFPPPDAARVARMFVPSMYQVSDRSPRART